MRTRAPRRPRHDPRSRDRRLAPSRTSIVGESAHIGVTPPGTVEGDDRIRLFLALELPEDVVGRARALGKAAPRRGRPVESFHVTLAFLGSQPRAALEPIVGALRREARCDRAVRARARALPRDALGRDARPRTIPAAARRRSPSACSSVSSASASTSASAAAGCRTSPCCASASARGSTLRCPRSAPFAPSGAAAFLSRLHPSGARYEVLESCSLERS